MRHIAAGCAWARRFAQAGNRTRPTPAQRSAFAGQRVPRAV